MKFWQGFSGFFDSSDFGAFTAGAVLFLGIVASAFTVMARCVDDKWWWKR